MLTNVASVNKIAVLSFLYLGLVGSNLHADSYEDGLEAAKRQEHALAMSAWEKAASEGHGGAQYELGRMFETGTGVSVDAVRARHWYEKAADTGEARAQLRLGLLLFSEGTSLVEAYKWIYLASKDKGSAGGEAKNYLEFLGNSLSTEEKSKGIRQAQDFIDAKEKKAEESKLSKLASKAKEVGMNVGRDVIAGGSLRHASSSARYSLQNQARDAMSGGGAGNGAAVGYPQPNPQVYQQPSAPMYQQVPQGYPPVAQPYQQPVQQYQPPPQAYQQSVYGTAPQPYAPVQQNMQMQYAAPAPAPTAPSGPIQSPSSSVQTGYAALQKTSGGAIEVPPPPPVNVAPARQVTTVSSYPAGTGVVNKMLSRDGKVISGTCAQLEIREASTKVWLVGRVEDLRAEQEAIALTKQAFPNRSVKTIVEHIGRPFCLMMDEIDDVQKLPSGSSVQFTLNSENTVFSKGEALQMKVGNVDFASYIYVDYFSSSGRVFHVTPNYESHPFPLPAGNLLEIGKQIRLGIGAPFGRELITVMASSSPLFPEKRSNAENTVQYISAVQAALRNAKAQGVQVAISGQEILTQEK